MIVEPEPGPQYLRGTLGWYRSSFAAATLIANLASTLTPTNDDQDELVGDLWLSAASLTARVLELQFRVGTLVETESEREVVVYWRAVRLPVVVLAAGVIAASRTRPTRSDESLAEPSLERGEHVPTTVSDDVWFAARQIVDRSPRDAVVVPVALDRMASAIGLASPVAALVEATTREVEVVVMTDFTDRVVRNAQLDKDQSGQTQYNIACYWTLRGKFDAAFEHLTSAIALATPFATAAATDPSLERLHADPRWENVAAASKPPSASGDAK